MRGGAGVPTTIDYHKLILDVKDFKAGNVDTAFIPKHAEELATVTPTPRSATCQLLHGAVTARADVPDAPLSLPPLTPCCCALLAAPRPAHQKEDQDSSQEASVGTWLAMPASLSWEPRLMPTRVLMTVLVCGVPVAFWSSIRSSTLSILTARTCTCPTPSRIRCCIMPTLIRALHLHIPRRCMIFGRPIAATARCHVMLTQCDHILGHTQWSAVHPTPRRLHLQSLLVLQPKLAQQFVVHHDLCAPPALLLLLQRRLA